jgi:hypothetical protein
MGHSGEGELFLNPCVSYVVGVTGRRFVSRSRRRWASAEREIYNDIRAIAATTTTTNQETNIAA